ncbi:MAG: triose-phosphate isomerase [Bacteroidetes bacterium CG2_30_32_10]|nr:MAG: triose-phosphate isomerase [Bacteroidetes bacterium CG2_30_32_10]
MRTKIVAGNWKMNKTLEEGVLLVKEIKQLLVSSPFTQSAEKYNIIIAPPFIHLKAINDLLIDDPFISIAAQNCSSEEKGAYTGEVSAQMIKSTGAKYIIIGHSERRNYFNESNAMLAKKINLVLSNNLLPIYCCGERLEERNTNIYFDVVKKQINDGLFHLSSLEISKVIIAYEPVWAIGTGLNATPQQAQEMHKFIRKVVSDKFGEQIANSISILYGGSCNAKNAKELFANPDVDGGLIGGASLIASDFVKIIQSF